MSWHLVVTFEAANAAEAEATAKKIKPDERYRDSLWYDDPTTGEQRLWAEPISRVEVTE
jgi:hypothetical protein